MIDPIHTFDAFFSFFFLVFIIWKKGAVSTRPKSRKHTFSSGQGEHFLIKSQKKNRFFLKSPLSFEFSIFH